jgi:hypothetical protein
MIEPKPPVGGPVETPANTLSFSAPRVAAFKAQVVLEGYDANTYYAFYICKNITIGAEGELRLFHLVHNKRLDDKNGGESEEKDYPPMEPGENFIEYMQRLEKLPYMEWNMMMFEQFQSCNLRGRTAYSTNDQGEYVFISGDRLSTKMVETEETSASSVVSFKGPTK